MNATDLFNVFLTVSSVTVGTFLGALSNKLIILSDKSWLHYILSWFAVAIAIFSAACLVLYWNRLTKPEILWLQLLLVVVSLLAGLALLWFTNKHLRTNKVFSTKQLDPIVNKFTQNASKEEIRLFAGDLNFFGNTPSEMNKNTQYTCLKNEQFDAISILCTAPKNMEDKIRYGKILDDMPEAELRYYNPPKPDLELRGRVKILQGVIGLLIYQKIASGRYKAIETDTANSHGALYDNLWKLLWSIARQPSDEDLTEYKKNYLELKK